MKHIKLFEDYINEYVNNKSESKWILNSIKDYISKKYDIVDFKINSLSSNICVSIVFNEFKEKCNFLNDEKFKKSIMKKYSDYGKSIYYSNYENDEGRLGINSIDIYLKDLYLKRVKPPRYVYHMTYKIYRDDILKNGLIPNKSENGYGSYSYNKPFVFATKNKTNLFTSLFLYDNPKDLDIWVIDTDKIDNKWFIDFNFPDEENHIITNKKIDPNAIKVYSFDKFKEKRLNERFLSKLENKFYLLFDELVYIDSIDYYGGEYRVEFTKSDHTKDYYISDANDLENDFKESNKSFPLKKYYEEPIKKTVKNTNDSIRYNLVYYIGNKKMETIEKNLNSKTAYSLKNIYSKNPKYRYGKIVVEKN